MTRTDVQTPLLPSDRTHHATPNLATTARHKTKHYLTSKTGHYSVLALVSDGEKAQETLGILSLVFSCLFMVELLASVWAFGWAYFGTWFHCFDAFVILAGFVIDVLLKGVLEEIGSLVIVLRLWRVFKIIEELSAGAEEQMEPLQERLEDVEKENAELKKQIEQLRARHHSRDANLV
ncbi:putative ion transport protein [Teratosphaeria destructans]|uniref:Voltage-gated hydrogen channel 1 n=1 Tax=Teratosphaeria destructans TaxID=418781 RepID=A0A9W7VXV9_9PEZI|nr:putative ion transport protein [Teratosphaeria destructans]